MKSPLSDTAALNTITTLLSRTQRDANTIDTVENVIIPAPLSGRWRAEVLADEVVKDGNPKTSEVDAVFALVVGGIRKR